MQECRFGCEFKFSHTYHHANYYGILHIAAVRTSLFIILSSLMDTSPKQCHQAVCNYFYDMMLFSALSTARISYDANRLITERTLKYENE